MASGPSARDLADKYSEIKSRSHYPAIREYGKAWNKSSKTTKARFLFGLYRSK